jgi:hypothetical protein
VYASSDQPAQIVLSPAPAIIMADGYSQSTITATVSLLGGSQAPDGVTVHFSTTLGVLSEYTATTVGGVARVKLTSASLPGKATVSATYTYQGSGANSSIDVEFTDDKSTANKDFRDDQLVEISSDSYLSYSEDSRIAELFGKSGKQGAHFSYNGIEISADSMQVDLQLSVLRARNASISYRGAHIATAAKVNWDFGANRGYAIIDDPNVDAGIRSVAISGIPLEVKPLNDKQAPDTSNFDYVDLSDDHVFVTAASLSFQLGTNIIFRHASVYLDAKKIMSVRVYQLPLNSTQVFGQQVFGYGTDGVYLNFPYYAAVSRKSTDTLYFRSISASVQNGGQPSSSSGITLDWDHAYKLDNNKGSGIFQLFGLQEGDNMGARWRQNEQFDKRTSGYLYIDHPYKTGLFTSGSLVHQFNGFSLNGVESYSLSQPSGGSRSDTTSSSVYVDTTPRRALGGGATTVKAVTDLAYSTSYSKVSNSASSASVQSKTDSVTQRFFTDPIKLQPSLSLSDSVRAGISNDIIANNAVTTWQADFGLNKTITKTTTASFNYNYSHNPQNITIVLVNDVYEAKSQPDTHHLGYNLSTSAPNGLWTGAFSADFTLPTTDKTFNTSFMYKPFNGTRITLNSMISESTGTWYRDFAVGYVQRFLTRDVDCSWSAIDHRIRVNVNSAGF